MSSERTRDEVWQMQVASAEAQGLTMPTRTDPADYDLLRELLGADVFEAMIAAEGGPDRG